MSNSRAKKSVYNIVTSLALYTLGILITFFSRSEFLDALGPEVLGLRYTIGNFFAVTSLAELGLGSVIGFSLYKPLVEDNKQVICEIISLQGWVYRKLAMFVFIVALCFCIASPFFFSDFQSPHWYIYASVIVLAWGTISSYLIGFRSVLLSADQKFYKLSIRTAWLGYLKNILQLLILMYVPDPYGYYLVVELVVSFAGLYILDFVVKKEYPWLKIDPSRGKYLFPRYKYIVTKVKQMAAHKIAEVALLNLSPLIMAAFSSLVVIGMYDNYMNLARNLMTIIVAVFGSLGAGIGTLVAEQNHQRTIRFFEEYRSVVHYSSLLVCFALYNLSHPLVNLWLGSQYIVSDELLGLIVIYIYIASSRISRDSFVFAYGLVGDTWAPIVETIVNISLGLLFGYFWGMKGALLGSLTSTIMIAVVWKSIYLCSRALDLSIWAYWRRELMFLSFALAVIVGGRFILTSLNLDLSTFALFFLKGAIIGLVVAVVSFIVYYVTSSGMRDFTSRMVNIIRKRAL